MTNLKEALLGDHRDPREVLAAEFGGTATEAGNPPPEALDWARGVLAAAKVDPRQDPVQAIKVLRESKDFGLKTTKYLVSNL